VRVAAADDAPALAAAFDGAAVVIGCAAPVRSVGRSIAAAAIAAGAHYVDAAGDQTLLRDIYEGLGSAARARGVVAVNGMGFEIAIGDWAASWAAARLAGGATGGARIAAGDPLDELTVSYAFDDAAFGFGARGSGWVWTGDRWDDAPLAGEQRALNFGPELGGERPAMSFPSGEVITVPRHVDARRIQTYVSLTRSRWLGAVTRAAAMLARGAAGRAGDDESMTRVVASRDEAARSRFAVIARARRRFVVSQVRVLGSDPAGLAATVCADAAIDLMARPAGGAVGACAPSELWPGEDSLQRLATAGRIEIDVS
jgi:hypothetical protein